MTIGKRRLLASTWLGKKDINVGTVSRLNVDFVSLCSASSVQDIKCYSVN